MLKIYIEKTKQYYNSLQYNMLCDCKDCQNYYLQVKAEYPNKYRSLSPCLSDF